MSDKLTIITLILAAIPTTIASVVAAIMAIKGTGVAQQTHKIVNGTMLLKFKLHAELHAKTARAVAIISATPENLAIAEEAEEAAKMLDDNKDKLIQG